MIMVDTNLLVNSISISKETKDIVLTSWDVENVKEKNREMPSLQRAEKTNQCTHISKVFI